MNRPDRAWTILAERPIYDNPWISLTEYDVLNPAGKPGLYGKMHFKNKAIGIIPIDDEGYVYLVGQTRFALSAYSWEIPAGGGPLDEDPLEAAKRELKEETGLVAGEWNRVLEMHLSNSVTDEHGFIFLATDLRMEEAEPEDTEDIRVLRIPLQEAYEMVTDGRITDAPTIMAILLVMTMMDRGEIDFKTKP
jgi:8-oxo-dGTP pyrophosphatase MutT (NUDIX family)